MFIQKGSRVPYLLLIQFQKDMMFRQGGVATNSLYSPAGTSDSSGFSEQRDSSFSPAPPSGQSAMAPTYQQHNSQNSNETIRIGATGALFSVSNQNTRPIDNSNGIDNRQNQFFQRITDGKGSPSLGHFSYHNPALTASPYSTLPRRPGAKPATSSRNMPQDAFGPGMNALKSGSNSYSTDKNSPLMLELSTVNSFRGGHNTSSLERKQRQNFSTPMSLISQPSSSTPPSIKSKVASIQRVTAKTPLLEDDRESCV